MQIEKRQMARRATFAVCILMMVLVVSLFVKGVSDAFQNDFSGGPADTVGEIRNIQLHELTAEYVSESPDGEMLVVNGVRFAPLHYLNSELHAMDASWRVEVIDDRIRFQEVA